MKRILLSLILALVLVPIAKADDLAGLTSDFRLRVNEPDTATSFFADSVAKSWLNQAQNKICRLTGFLQKVHADTFVDGQNKYGLTGDARSIRAVLIESDDIWYNITVTGPDPDPSVLEYEFIRDDENDTSWVHLKLGGYMPRVHETTFDIDSSGYDLPARLKSISGVTIWASGSWQPVMHNPFFMIDTTAYQYDIAWFASDSALLMMKAGNTLSDGDTIRVHYMAGAATGDSLIVAYSAAATAMTATDSECDLADDLEVFVIDEAATYYYQAKGNLSGHQAVYQESRTDLGLYKQEQQGKE